jgi:adenylosuccinate synthase
VGDLRRIECALALLGERVERANQLLQMLGSADRVSLADLEALLRRWSPRLLPLAADTGLLVHRALHQGRRVLLEGAQGALLDVDHGTYPFVTSSNTTSGGAAVGAGIGPTAIQGVLGVVKAYTTRVGNGPLPTEALDDAGARLRELGGEFGAVTGRPRRCGWFDANVVRYSARVNGLTGLAVTKLDVLDTFDELPIGVAYLIDGERSDEFPSAVDVLGRVQPVYERMLGWRRSTADARRLADLPGAARAYLDRLEKLSEVPVRYVSVGTRRDQIIEVE